MSKLKVILNRHAESIPFSLGNKTLEEVGQYDYLGQVLSADSNHEKEIWRRISMGWRAFGKHSDVMNSRLPLSLKIKVYDQCVLPVMTCGAETWRLTKQLVRNLGSAQRAMEGRMIGVTLKDRKRAFWIREQTRVDDVTVQIEKKKWTWAGHVVR